MMDLEFKYGINAIRALVRETGKTPPEIMMEFDPRDIDLGVTLIWAGLLWKKKGLTVDQVGDMLDAEEGSYFEAITKAMEVLIESFKRSFGIKNVVSDLGEALSDLDEALELEPGKN